MTEPRTFPMGTVLSVTTGRLLAPEGIGGLYDILNYCTGDQLFSHQLPRAADFVRPKLIELFPALGNVDTSQLDTLEKKDTLTPKEYEMRVWTWLETEIAALALGKNLSIPCFSEGWISKNPIQELVQLTSEGKSKRKKQVIVGLVTSGGEA